MALSFFKGLGKQGALWLFSRVEIGDRPSYCLGAWGNLSEVHS